MFGVIVAIAPSYPLGLKRIINVTKHGRVPWPASLASLVDLPMRRCHMRPVLDCGGLCEGRLAYAHGSLWCTMTPHREGVS